MAVHPDSKIDVWLNDFNPAFYVSLTDKEEWTYNEYEDDVEELNAWKDYFQQLMDKINLWANAEYLERGVLSTKSLISTIATYIRIYGQFNSEDYDLGEDQTENFSADNIYNLNGFFDVIISRPVDYYSDLAEIPPEPPELDPTYESEKMIADLESLEESAWQPAEKASISAILNSAGSAAATVNYTATFGDLPPQTTFMSKQSIATMVFEDLKFGFYKQHIPGIKGIDIPVYPGP